MAENRDFISEMDEVDQGSASSPRHFETVSPIPIPSDFPISMMADMARSLNRVTSNMDILFRRQEYSMRQSLTLCNQLRKSFVDLEYSTNQKLDSIQSGLDIVDRNTDGFSDKLENVHIDVGKSIDLITNFQTAFGKSRYSFGVPRPGANLTNSPDISSDSVPSVPMPDFSRDLEKTTTNISSLSAQIGSIQNLIKRPSSPISHVSAPPPHVSVPPSVPVSSRPLTSILRNATPGPSATPRPNTPVHSPSRPNTPKKSEDLYLNFSVENINEGHIWFTEKAISLPEDNISWWARVLSLARWGPLKSNGFHVGVGYFQTPVLKKRLFILDCIRRAFTPGGCYAFPMPPSSYVRAAFKDCMKDYNWVCWSGVGNMTRPLPGPIRVAFCPGTFLPERANAKPQQATQSQPPPSNLGIPSSVPSQNQPTASTSLPNIPNSVPSSSQRSPRVDDTPHPSDPFNPSLDAYYEDQNPDPTPWHVVNHTKPSFAQAASSTPFHGPSGPRTRPQRKTPFSNNQKWILRFPPKDKPSEGTRSLPQVITDKVNHACKDSYHVRAVMADWTQAGNMSITFSHDTKETNISNTKGTIISLFNPSNVAKTKFTKAVPLSKILYPLIPCRNISSDSDAEDMEQDSSPLWSRDRLLEEVKRSHPLLANAEFIQEPDWTVASVPSPNIRANISFAVEDVDGSILSSLTNSSVIMFSTEIFPRAWKEKVNLQQCPRCFKLTAPHSNCPIRCAKCGSPNHDIIAHNQNCQGCKNTGRPLDQIKSSDWICTHDRCLNCGGSHRADNTSCQARDIAIREARLQKSGMTGQTIIDARDLRRPSPSHVRF